MKYSEKWGDSVDAAVALALQDLGLERDKVTVTVLEEPSKGFFGIGSKLAKVRVEEKEAKVQPKEEEPKEAPKAKRVIYTNQLFPAKEEDAEEEFTKAAPETSKAQRQKKSRREGRENGRRQKTGRQARGAETYAYGEAKILGDRPADLVLSEDHPVKTFLSEVFEKMGLNLEVKVYTNKDSVYADVDGPDSGTVIGKRGHTLDAIQYLASLVVNKEENGYIRVVVDAESYRQKRELTLEKLANRLADKAASSGKTVRLEPMNPYERKVIHTALQKRPEVSTRSEGEEPFRRVIIEPSK